MGETKITIKRNGFRIENKDGIPLSMIKNGWSRFCKKCNGNFMLYPIPGSGGKKPPERNYCDDCENET